MKLYAVEQDSYDGSGKYFRDIYPSIMQVQMCAEPDTPIYEVDVERTTDTENSYWAWSDEYDDIAMIYPVFLLLDMCFPDGVKAEEAAGRGEIIRVTVKRIGRVL